MTSFNDFFFHPVLSSMDRNLAQRSKGWYWVSLNSHSSNNLRIKCHTLTTKPRCSTTRSHQATYTAKFCCPTMSILSHPKTYPRLPSVAEATLITNNSLIHDNGERFRFVTTHPPAIVPAQATTMLTTPKTQGSSKYSCIFMNHQFRYALLYFERHPVASPTPLR